MPLGDQGVTLLHALPHVLLMEAAGQLEKVIGVVGVHGIVGGGGGRGRLRRHRRGHRGRDSRRRSDGSRRRGGTGGGALELTDAGLAGNEALTQLLVFLIQATQFDDDLIEEVIDLVLVVSLAELCRIEPLVDYVFRSQSHLSHLVVFHHVVSAPPGRRASQVQAFGSP